MFVLVCNKKACLDSIKIEKIKEKTSNDKLHRYIEHNIIERQDLNINCDPYK